MLRKVKAVRVYVFSLGFLLAQTALSAPLLNDGFESGDFSGWSLSMYYEGSHSPLGLAPFSSMEDFGSVVDGSINVTPAHGGYQALLSTGPSAAFPVTPNGSKLTSLTPLVLLDRWELSFDWNFLTDELAYISEPEIDYGGENIFNDRGGVALKNLLTNEIIDIALAGAKEFDGNLLDAALPGSLGRPVRETGYTSYHGSFDPGSYELYFYVTDIYDTSIKSFLLLDNIRVVPVPEPGSFLMLLFGLLGLSFSRRRLSARSN